MSYFHVMPRDFIREGNLLIGNGNLYSKLNDLNNSSIEFVEDIDGEPPVIILDESTGGISIGNKNWCSGIVTLFCFLPLGAESWTDLKMDFCGNVVDVFEKDGGLSGEFLLELSKYG